MEYSVLSRFTRLAFVCAMAVAVSALFVITACGDEATDLATDDGDGAPQDSVNNQDSQDNSSADTTNQQGGNTAPEENNDDDVANTANPLTICQTDTDCLDDEACTQGGHCVNITGDRDATAALQADLDDLAAPVGIGTPYRLPANAILQLNDLDGDGVALTVHDKIIFEGNGSNLNVENGTIGLRITQDAQWSMVRDLHITPQNQATEHDGIGIDVRSHGVRLDNIYFLRMGTGVRAHTTVDGEFANVNTQQWSRLVFHYIHNKATDLAGGDANSGTMLGLEAVGGAGIHDNSFLGNNYIGTSMEGTHTQSMKLGSNAASHTVIGSYVEITDPEPTSESLRDVFVGGNAIKRVQGPGDRLGGHASRIRFRHPGTSGVEVKIPGHANAAIGFKHPDEGDWWYLRYFSHPTMLSWGLAYKNSGTMPFSWTGGQHPDGPALFDMGEEL